ncbi:hypothetical protein V6N11_060238 [Hibiscus sabdariffa]|uniref:Uncharacterized protein n=1 Tax=Hibiscus sabdariffa TaxID=183260 RepID=A0ABR2QPR3_9ROSI
MIRASSGMSFPLVDGAMRVCMGPKVSVVTSSSSRLAVPSSRQEHVHDVSSNVGDTSMCGQDGLMSSLVTSRPYEESDNPPIDASGALNSNGTELNATYSSAQQLVSQSNVNEESGAITMNQLNQLDTQDGVQ